MSYLESEKNSESKLGQAGNDGEREWFGGGLERMEKREMYAADHLVINEFMASNDTGIVDENGDFSDWIEIYNPTGDAVNLLGWSLTDESADLTKWAFPDVDLGGGEFLVVFASNKDRDLGELHTNFKLGSSGEYLGLVDGSQTVVHAYDPSYPGQVSDQSYGLVDGVVGSDVYFAESSAGSENAQPTISETVTFSRVGGNFISNFSLSLHTAFAGGVIHYTTDNSFPTSSSPVYNGTISVNSTVNVRAMVSAVGYADSAVTSASFVKLASNVQNFTSDLPIVVLENWGAGDLPNKGYSSDGTGIVQVPRQASNISVYGDKDQTGNALNSVPTLDSRMGNRIRGSFSSTFAHKAYAVETWNEHDLEQNINPFGFGEESDWILYYPNHTRDRSLFGNSLMWDLSQQMGQWAPKFQYVELFLHTDGGTMSMDDYEGVYILVEKVKRDEHRLDFEALSEDGSEGGWIVGINRKDAEPIGGGSPQYFRTAGPNLVRESVPNGGRIGDDFPRQWNAFFNFDTPNGYKINTEQRSSIEDWMYEFETSLFGNDWLDPTNGYQKYLDVDSFVDYFILHNITKNSDGLLISMWVYKESANSKLKMGPIWDLDLGYNGSPTTGLMYNADRLWYGRLFSDPSFKQAYIDRWQELRGDIFSEENITETIANHQATIGEVAAIRHGHNNWQSDISNLQNFILRRATAIDNLYRPGVLIERESGDVVAGTRVAIDGSGSLYYTLDGSDPRLPDGSISPRALLLDGSNDDSTVLLQKQSSWLYLDDGSNQGTAWRASGFDDGGWASGQGELGYGDGDENTVLDYGGDVNNKYVTSYFRKTINVSDPGEFDAFKFEVKRDDGAIIYVNGVEVQRMNFDEGVTVTYDMFAQLAADENSYFEFTVDPSYFVAGENTIAVEIHQAGGNSSDISFDMRLSGLLPGSVQGVTVDEAMVLAIRSKSGSNWSGLTKRKFTVGGVGISALPVLISEINYNPVGPTSAELGLLSGEIDASDFEYIELVGIKAGDDSGSPITGGLSFRVAGNGEVFIKNTTAAVQEFEGYHLSSKGGLFNVGNWNSLSDQEGQAGISGWGETPGQSHQLFETNLVGLLSLAVGQEVSLGLLINVDAVASVISGNDISFEYIDTSLDIHQGFIAIAGAGNIDLSGLRLEDSKGVIFEFNPGQFLAADGRLVLVRNEAAFVARYGQHTAIIAGEYLRQFSNSGEQLRLVDSNGRVIHDFAYDSGGSWSGRADGKGSSLEIKGINQGLDYNDSDSWASSEVYLGTPGSERVEITTGVIINEVITHTDLPNEDQIELYNSGETWVDVSGWYLSDSNNNYFKYRIANGTVIASGDFLVLSASDFDKVDPSDPNNPAAESFGLSAAHGDDLWLTSSGSDIRFIDHVQFGAAFNIALADGTSLGRLVGDHTTERLVHLDLATMGDVNSSHRVSDVVISEVMYHPADDNDQLEYIELFNQSDGAIDISQWRLDNAVEFTFEAGTIIEAYRTLLVVPFDLSDTVALAAFNAAYSIPTNAVMIGGYSGKLGDGGDRVQLERPDSPPLEEPTFTPYILQDEVNYNDSDGWPADADGLGQSLTRVVGRNYGNAAGSWVAGTPSPGKLVGDINFDGTTDQDDTAIVTSGFGSGFTLLDLFGVRNHFDDVTVAAAAIVPDVVLIEETEAVGDQKSLLPVTLEDTRNTLEKASPDETVIDEPIAADVNIGVLGVIEDSDANDDTLRTRQASHQSLYELLEEEDDGWII